MNFRAYKISEKKMLPINSLESICINSERLTQEEWNDLVIMRGTGLLDKEGVEVFEGDLCKTKLGEVGSIMYSDGCFWLFFHEEPNKMPLYEFKKYNKEFTDLLIFGLRSFNNTF